jgi:protein-tyrosine-phosphatase
VAIAEIRSDNKVAYALEIERTNQQHAILVMTRSDWQEIRPSARQWLQNQHSRQQQIADPAIELWSLG